MLTKNDLSLLDKFLEDLSDSLGNNSCNDYILPDTEENRRMLIEAYDEEDDFDIKNCIYKDKLMTYDFIIVGYLRRKLKEE